MVIVMYQDIARLFEGSSVHDIPGH